MPGDLSARAPGGGNQLRLLRRAAVLLTAAAVLFSAADADAVRSGGHNTPTRKLEIAFKVAGGQRAGSKDGCYWPPRRMVELIRFWGPLPADLARGLGAVRTPGVVYVIGPRSSCNRMVFALRSGGDTYILNTSAGEVYKRGEPPDRRGGEADRLGQGPLRSVTFSERSFRLRKADRARRLTITCPGSSQPLGGGLRSDPGLGPDGEGVYPHSFERLGVQRGFHSTALIIDPTPRHTTARSATLQVVCGTGLVPMSSPHRTVFVRRRSSNTATATCPAGQLLFGGGFQRTNFTTPYRTYGGNYITESRAISPTAWQVSAYAAGHDGGELTAIAYCATDESLPLVEVQASSPVPSAGAALATTPPCPPGLELTSGGFNLDGAGSSLFGGGFFNEDGTWSATAFGYFGAAPALTAYGYCLRPADA
jgi:hypothetical protein